MTEPTKDSLPSVIGERLVEAQGRLDALDENDGDYEVQKMIAENRVANLQRAQTEWQGEEERCWLHEENLRALQDEDERTRRFSGSQGRPHSSDGVLNPSAGFAPYAGSTVNAFGGHFASDGAMTGQGNLVSAPQWGSGLQGENRTGSTTTTYDSNDAEPLSSASISSPDSTFALPQKRRRSSPNLTPQKPDNRNKIARPSENTTGMGLTSPESMDSFELPEDVPEEWWALFGGDPKAAAEELRESRMQQEEYDRMVAARQEQERLDEQYAMSLQDEENSSTSPTNRYRAGPSNGSSMPTQTYFDPQGAYSRPLPIMSSSSSPPMKFEDPFASRSNLSTNQNNVHSNSIRAPIKTEPSNQTAQSPTYGGQGQADFVYISSDDDDGNWGRPFSQSSSDVVEVDPHTWQPRQASNVTPSLANAQTGFVPHITNTLGNAANNIGNAANNIYNAAMDLAGQSSYDNSSGMGGTSVYGLNATLPHPWAPEYDLNHLVFGTGTSYQSNLNRMGIDQNDPSNEEMVNRYRDRYDYLVNDPTRTAAEIKELLENIRPDEDLPPEDREGTPDAMTYPLMEHQKLGLAWMRRMEEGSNKGGILADDMGLGKTIQALALMVSRRSTVPARKTTLIVAPVALLRQWQREIEKKLRTGKEHKLSSFILHGAARHTPWEKLRTFDVVITTFGILATEVKHQEQIERHKKANPNWRPTSKADNLCLLGDNSHWYRVIIDEAQCIKNKNTRAAIGACRLKAETRFCMTGTPMMNNVGELYSLVHFLRIKPYCEEKKFGLDIGRPLRSQSRQSREKAMKLLQALLKSILLRRTKKSEIDGKPILNLPERTTECQHAEFNQDQAEFYRALESRTRLQFNKYLKAGTVGRNYSNILVLLLRLRQACCHPHLIKDFGQTGSPSDVTAEQMMALAKELAPDVVNRIKEQAGQNDYTSLECPVCMDMSDNATIFIPCGHDTCSECFARISDPSAAIAEGDFSERNIDAKCPNCRGKITPSRVIDFNSFKKVHMPEHIQQDAQESDVDDDEKEETDSDDESGDDSDENEYVDSKGNLKGFVVDDDAEDSQNGEEEDSEEDTKAKAKREIKALEKSMKKSKGKGKAKAKEKKITKSLAELKKEAGLSAKARKKYLRKLEKDWESSSKIDRTLEILREVQSRKDPITRQSEKTIIFSQFTSLLDLLEVPINREGWDYRRYDGSMSPKARNDAVIDFSDKPECKIMLVSLKAGNAGLNLTAASQVIVFDPFWNPYIEEQAIDRAHRIGQMKPVRVHRMLVPNTVEDRIIQLQEKKRELIESALDENASKNMGRLGLRDLAFLFDVQS